MSSEYKEGYNAYWKGKSKSANPYDWSETDWWSQEDWDRGWDAAKIEDYYDDD
ncbi:hypothetical protein [Shewanella sp. SW24]|jgi:ribosome modulation factor|uniref:hypothetical protein n=1 Tax=Shewanella TaxID=22 RepID=UPI0021D92E00|nr:hypothetical protein [Shewanella sp. SW24]MCU7988136.1 hypothetical protein [Shewanella sp. SW24]